MDEADIKLDGLDRQQIVAGVKEAMATYGLSQTQVAKQAGMSSATISAFLGGTYRGNEDAVAAKLQTWRNGLAEKEMAQGALGRLNVHSKTDIGARIAATLKISRLREMVLICGPSGVGKTEALLRFKRDTPSVWYVQCTPDMASIFSVLSEIFRAVGGQKVSTRSDIIRHEIIARIKRTGGVLLIDEAQHLLTEGLEEIRALYDSADAKIGIVFAGHEDLKDKIGKLPQLDGRITASLHTGKATPADADVMLTDWKITDKDARKLLRELAPYSGGLRQIKAIVKHATTYALAEGVPLSFEHIRDAYEERNF